MNREERRQHLRNYIIEVARDLVGRGIIGHANGMTLPQIIARDGAKVLKEIEEDFRAVTLEFGWSLLGGIGRSIVGQFLDRFVPLRRR